MPAEAGGVPRRMVGPKAQSCYFPELHLTSAVYTAASTWALPYGLSK